MSVSRPMIFVLSAQALSLSLSRSIFHNFIFIFLKMEFFSAGCSFSLEFHAGSENRSPRTQESGLQRSLLIQCSIISGGKGGRTVGLWVTRGMPSRKNTQPSSSGNLQHCNRVPRLSQRHKPSFTRRYVRILL